MLKRSTVSVSYCCVTNQPKIKLLRTIMIYYFLQFCGLGIWTGFRWEILLLNVASTEVTHLAAFGWHEDWPGRSKRVSRMCLVS